MTNKSADVNFNMMGEVHKNNVDGKVWVTEDAILEARHLEELPFLMTSQPYLERRQDIVLLKQPKGTQPLLNFTTSGNVSYDLGM